MTDHRIFNVLFLCTGNSSRSIMAEALLNEMGQHRFHAFSAGSHPCGSVHPLAVEQLKRLHLPTDTLRSKSWDEFGHPDAPQMDFIITVCDNAAGEVCPRWPGHPITAHWSIEDPAAFKGDEQARCRCFAKVCQEIKNRLDRFTALPLEKLSRLAIQREIDAMGQQETRVTDTP